MNECSDLFLLQKQTSEKIQDRNKVELGVARGDFIDRTHRKHFSEDFYRVWLVEDGRIGSDDLKLLKTSKILYILNKRTLL